MTHNFRTSTHVAALAAVTLSSATYLAPAHAQTQNAASPVTLRSEVKVERTERGADGNEKTTLHTPNEVAVVPGDNVIFTLFVNNTGAQPAVAFGATNPIPSAICFTSVTEDWADV